MSEQFMLPSQSILPRTSEAKTSAARRAVMIESIRLAVRAGTYRITGELVACRMIERYLHASIH